MRPANLFLFLGTVGFINIYEEFAGDDDAPGNKMDPSDAKRLQRKFGVKERRSPASAVAAAAAANQLVTPAGPYATVNIEEYTEELIEYLKRPVYRGLSACGKADGTLCNCLRLVCFGQAECTLRNGTAAPSSTAQNPPAQPLVRPSDPRYVYYATGARLRARQSDASPSPDRFVRCRQTTIDPYVLCECKRYTRNRALT